MLTHADGATVQPQLPQAAAVGGIQQRKAAAGHLGARQAAAAVARAGLMQDQQGGWAGLIHTLPAGALLDADDS